MNFKDHYYNKDASVKLGLGQELVYNTPFKINNHYDVYYVIEREKEDDDVTVWHYLVTKDGKNVNHIELTSYDTLTPEEVQQYINAGMPKSKDMQEAGTKQVGGSFSRKELQAYLDTLGPDKNEVNQLETNK
jgi:hypothetical protein